MVVITIFRWGYKPTYNKGPHIGLINRLRFHRHLHAQVLRKVDFDTDSSLLDTMIIHDLMISDEAHKMGTILVECWEYYYHYCYLGVSIVMGVPQKWMVYMGKSYSFIKIDDLGVPPF